MKKKKKVSFDYSVGETTLLKLELSCCMVFCPLSKCPVCECAHTQLPTHRLDSVEASQART